MMDKQDFQNLVQNLFPDWFLQIWKWCWDLLNRVGILVTLTGTSGFLGFIRLLRRDTRWITWAILLLCVILAGLLFWRCWKIYRKKVPVYSRKQLRFAKIGLFLIPCILIFIFSRGFILNNLPTQDAIILVTKFDGNPNIKIDDLIGDELEKLTKNDSKIKILYSDEIIPLKQGREKAQKIGKAQKATVVIWGGQKNNNKETVNDIRLTLLKSTGKFFLGKSLIDGNRQIIPAAELEEFRPQLHYAKNISFYALLAVAMTQASFDNWDQAIELINKLLLQTEEPLERSYVFDILTLFYLGKGDYEKALENNNEALSLQGDHHNANTLHSRGIIFLIRNNYEQALKYFDEALKKQPDKAGFLSSRGVFFASRGDYNQALKYFNEALNIQPNDTMNIRNIGVIYLYKNNYKAAINNFKKAINKAEAENHDSLEVNNDYFSLADAYCQQNNFERCIDAYSYIIKSTSWFEKVSLNIGLKQVRPKKIMGLAKVYNNRGSAYKDKGELSLAIADFNQAIKLLTPFLDQPILDQPINSNPKGGIDSNLLLAWAYNNRGLAYSQKSRFAPLHYSRSKGYSKKRLLDFAINDFNKALELGEFRAAYENRINTYINQHKFDLAIADLDKLMSWHYLSRAQAYQNQGDFKSSLADYNKSIELDSNNYYAYVDRGILLANYSIELQTVNIFDTLNKALQDLNTAIELEPENPIAYRHSAEVYQLGYLYNSQNNNKRDRQKALEYAIHQLTKAIDLEQSRELYKLRGRIYRDIGNLNLAEKDFNTVIEIGSNCISDHCEAYIELGKVYEQMGKPDLARDKFNYAINYFTKIINFGYNNPEDYFWRGRTYDEMGDFELALTDYSKAIALNPNNINYKHHRLGLIMNYAENSLSYKKNKSQEAVTQILNEELEKADDILKKIKSELETKQNIAVKNPSIVIDNQSNIENQIAEYNEDIAEVQLRRGIIYSYNGEQQNAISDFKQVLELAKNSIIRQAAQKQFQKLCIQTRHRSLYCPEV